MKADLSPKATAAILGVVALVVVVAAFLYFRPSLGPGPEVQPREWKPPGNWQNAPGAAPAPGQ